MKKDLVFADFVNNDNFSIGCWLDTEDLRGLVMDFINRKIDTFITPDGFVIFRQSIFYVQLWTQEKIDAAVSDPKKCAACRQDKPIVKKKEN